MYRVCKKDYRIYVSCSILPMHMPSFFPTPSPPKKQQPHSSPTPLLTHIKATEPMVLPLSSAQPTTSGAKAASCAELARLESRGTGSFRTPAGCVLPYGAMDLAIRAAGLEPEFVQLLRAVENADLTSLDGLCGDLQELVAQARPDAATLMEIGMLVELVMVGCCCPGCFLGCCCSLGCLGC